MADHIQLVDTGSWQVMSYSALGSGRLSGASGRLPRVRRRELRLSPALQPPPTQVEQLFLESEARTELIFNFAAHAFDVGDFDFDFVLRACLLAAIALLVPGELSVISSSLESSRVRFLGLGVAEEATLPTGLVSATGSAVTVWDAPSAAAAALHALTCV